jgi:hypothetical protein
MATILTVVIVIDEDQLHGLYIEGITYTLKGICECIVTTVGQDRYR